MKNRIPMIAALFAAAALVSPVHAAIPRTIAFQGVLTNASRVPLPDGTYPSVTFRLYDNLTGPTQLWVETKAVVVAGGHGVFATALGSATAIPLSLLFDQPYWLSVEVGSDPEMTPRLPLQSVPYALNAWSVGGNAGTNQTTSFLGTTDNQPLVLKANNHRVLQLQDAINAAGTVRSVNTLGGAETNTIAAGVVGGTIAGGGGATGNSIAGDFGFIGGGTANSVDAFTNTVVSGGSGNVAQSAYSAIGGGSGNNTQADYTMIGGGYQNYAGAKNATVSGGTGNQAIGESSAIAGGSTNSAVGSFASVGGGFTNGAVGSYASVGGGFQNQSTGRSAFVGGGANNAAMGSDDLVVGGSYNQAVGEFAVIVGGQVNVSAGLSSAVVGGEQNKASGARSFIGGGWKNETAGAVSTVAGGYGNQVLAPITQDSAAYATIGGGVNNVVYGYASTVAGGQGNTVDNANASNSVIGGGAQNQISAAYATIPGGYSNYATGLYSFAAGRKANAFHEGSFVWADNSIDGYFNSSAPHQFCIRAAGGMVLEMGGSAYIYTGTGGVELNRYLELLNSPDRVSASGLKAGGILCADDYGFADPDKNSLVVKGAVAIGTNSTGGRALYVNGLAGGTSDWNSTSDARLKTNVSTIDSALDTVESLRGVMFDWRSGTGLRLPQGRQVGFIAQEVEKVLPSMVATDNQGYKSVAYANVVPVLVEAVKEQQREIKAQQAEVATLRSELAEARARAGRVDSLERRMERIERGTAIPRR